MKLIPVIDVMHGGVVVANGGKRHAYAPADTPLCHSNQPREVMSALLDLYPFDTLYIADLDAICGSDSNLEMIYKLHRQHPDINFWVDNGLTDLGRLCSFARPVIGTESIVSCDQLAHLLASLPSPILSLDYHDDCFKGPPGLDRKADCWPGEIIVMSLSRVGTSSGPDLARIDQLLKRKPESRLYAAGGVRDQQDLEQLRSIGTAGVLLSTALHQCALDHEDIDHFVNA